MIRKTCNQKVVNKTFLQKECMMIKKIILCVFAGIFFTSCQTVHFDKQTVENEAKKVSNVEADEKHDKKEIEKSLILEELKEVDVEKTVVYVEKPVYYPIEEKAEPAKTGTQAVKESIAQAVKSPQKFSGGVMYYDYDESFVYEIYCQPYRVTNIALQPGEMVLEIPFLSENQVWEIGAGVSQKNGQDVQHFFLKPDVSNLTTTMIVITDRRVYHFLLKSFKDCYMAMVRFEYPDTMPFNIKMDAMNERINALKKDTALVDPRFLSFDYKMSYSVFRKPLWLPKRVYDDGRRTYIQLDERVLHSESPVLFDKRNERINYRVQKNLIIIDELIEKVTLRRSNEKVTIRKKNYKEEPAPVLVLSENKTEVKQEVKKEQKGILLKKNNNKVLDGNAFGWEAQ